MEEENLGDSGLNPLAIASIVLGPLGMVVYCCGSFVCLGWVGIFVWMLGLVLGGVALFQGGGATSKALAWVGVVINLLGLLLMGAMMILGFGIGVLGSVADHM